MLPTLAANTAAHICGIRTVLKVILTGCRQSGFQLLRPFPIGLGEPPNLVGGQAEVTERRAERLAAVDGVEELLP